MWCGIAALPQPCGRLWRLLQQRGFAPPYGRSRQAGGTAGIFNEKTDKICRKGLCKHLWRHCLTYFRVFLIRLIVAAA